MKQSLLQLQKGYIQIIKIDADTNETIIAANTTFEIHKADGTVVGNITTNSNGTATSELLRYRDYYLTKKQAPHGYIQNDGKIKYTINEDGKIYSAKMKNKRVTGEIELSKVDKTPQGEGSNLWPICKKEYYQPC